MFTCLSIDHPRCLRAIWICVCGHIRDVVIYSKFHQNPFWGFGATEGRNLVIPITLAIGFYNSLYYTVVNACINLLVHGQVTIIFVVSVCLSVCLFVCAEFFSAVFDPISIKLGNVLYVWV